MSATIETIRAKIKSELEGVIVDGSPAFAVVYDYHESNFDGYPVATFDLSNNEDDFLTNKENLRAYSFQIVAFQETKIIVGGLKAATKFLDKVAQEVIKKFESNETLDGIVHWCSPVSGPRQMFDTPQGLVVAQLMTLRCHSADLV